VREVTGSSPVSSTIKTALFERKERFFLAFLLVLRDGIPFGFPLDVLAVEAKLLTKRAVAFTQKNFCDKISLFLRYV
jgi:hypothetical protein